MNSLNHFIHFFTLSIIEGLQEYGEKNIKQIAELVGTRTVIQVRSHLQKYKIKLEKRAERADLENLDSVDQIEMPEIASKNYDTNQDIEASR